MRNKIIQVPVPQDLLDSLDSLTRKQGKSRSAVIREACAHYVAQLNEEELDRQYAEHYKEHPETSEEKARAEAGLKLAAEVWEDEDWSEWYDEDERK